MFILFGTKGRITTSSEEDLLNSGCPNCNSDLELKDLKQWFTLFFIPIFPFEKIDSFYQCNECQSSYKKSARQVLLGATREKNEVEKESRKLFGMTLIACMTHMANIDGEISLMEIEQINNAKENYSDHYNEIEELIENIKNSDCPEDIVFPLLRRSSEKLTSKAIMSIIGLSANVLLADGEIDNEEEKLMKEYLLVCGLPKSMYNTIIDKV